MGRRRRRKRKRRRRGIQTKKKMKQMTRMKARTTIRTQVRSRSSRLWSWCAMSVVRNGRLRNPALRCALVMTATLVMWSIQMGM